MPLSIPGVLLRCSVSGFSVSLLLGLYRLACCSRAALLHLSVLDALSRCLAASLPRFKPPALHRYSPRRGLLGCSPAAMLLPLPVLEAPPWCLLQAARVALLFFLWGLLGCSHAVLPSAAQARPCLRLLAVCCLAAFLQVTPVAPAGRFAEGCLAALV